MLILLISLLSDAVNIFARNPELIDQKKLKILVYTRNIHHIRQTVCDKLVFILGKSQISYVLPNLYRNITINMIQKISN
jgi:hypothetical protein